MEIEAEHAELAEHNEPAEPAEYKDQVSSENQLSENQL